jgi:gamma-glutamylcyclotransferase (GGCT)/AIG2-like uncharacterized protein YtfP
MSVEVGHGEPADGSARSGHSTEGRQLPQKPMVTALTRSGFGSFVNACTAAGGAHCPLPLLDHVTRLFAYGTLRTGYEAHAQCCRGVLGAEPARVWGRLFELPHGYPALQVPAAAVIVEAGRGAEPDHAAYLAAVAKGPTVASMAGRGNGELRPILGELITLADPLSAWEPLDRWEGIGEGGDELYRRVLVAVESMDGAPTVAWTYVVPLLPTGSRELAAAEWKGTEGAAR